MSKGVPKAAVVAAVMADIVDEVADREKGPKDTKSKARKLKEVVEGRKVTVHHERQNSQGYRHEGR